MCIAVKDVLEMCINLHYNKANNKHGWLFTNTNYTNIIVTICFIFNNCQPQHPKTYKVSILKLTKWASLSWASNQNKNICTKLKYSFYTYITQTYWNIHSTPTSCKLHLHNVNLTKLRDIIIVKMQGVNML